MSVRANRRMIVYVLIALVFMVLVTSPHILNPLVILPGFGYRAYEWHWQVQWGFNALIIPDPFWNQWVSDLETICGQKARLEFSNIRDDAGKNLTIYSGPTTALVEANYVQIPYSGKVVSSMTVDVKLWFYGYFPNGIPEAQPLPSLNPFGELFDFFCPKAYAFAFPLLAVVVVAIAAVIITAIMAVTVTHLVNMLIERERAKQAQKWPEWMQFLYYALQSTLAFLGGLGPMWIILIAAVVVILVFAGGGRRR